MPVSSSEPSVQSERTYGAAMIYADVLLDVSQEMAEHCNTLAEEAEGVLPGSYVPFEASSYGLIAIPAEPVQFQDGLERVQRLRVEIDDEIEIRFREHPRFLSFTPDDLNGFRNGPTWVREDYFPEGFFGRTHSVRLFDGDTPVWGPTDRHFAGRSSGVVYREIEDGSGKLTVLVANADAHYLTGHGINPMPLMALWSSPAFGLPSAARQVLCDGNAHQLGYDLIGHDAIGETHIFNEGVLTGFDLSDGGDLRIEVDFPERGTGLAVVMWGGHTTSKACRPDASVA